MKRLAELLDLYLETEDRQKLNEDSYRVFSNRMKSIRDSSLDPEEFIQLSMYYNNLYQAEHDFIQLLISDKKLEDIKNDFKFNEIEIKKIYEKHSKDLYEKEYNMANKPKKEDKNSEDLNRSKKEQNAINRNINKEKPSVNNENKNNKRDHKCNCGGNCNTKSKSENKKNKTLEDIIKELSKDIKNPDNIKLNGGEDLGRVFFEVFKTLNDPNQNINKEGVENIIKEMIKSIFGE